MKNNYALLNTFALDPKKVKVQLIQQDKVIGRMALDLGLGQPTVSKYVNGRGRNPKIQQAIADYLGVPLDDILLKEDCESTERGIRSRNIIIGNKI